MIELKQLAYAHHGGQIIHNINITLQPNSIYGIIGPNGVGKSTLLQLIAGVIQPTAGEVKLDHKSLQSYSRKHLAQKIAVLQQGGLPPLSFTVDEVVGLGRFPYQSWLGFEAASAETTIEEAIEMMGLTHLRYRRLDQLSGGERQRVALAKIIVQEPSILLLDEPTTYLDIGYQQSIMDVVQNWQKRKELLVIAVLHDLNLAAIYCEQLIALHKGEIYCTGSPNEVMKSSIISTLYDADTVIIDHPQLQVPQLLLQRRED